MADTKLFNIKGAVKEYQSGTVTLEKELQTVIENNMNIFFGESRLAKSEKFKKIAAHPKQSVRLNKNVLFSLLSTERSISVRTQKFVSFIYGLSDKSCNTEFQSIILIGVLKSMSSQLKQFVCCI